MKKWLAGALILAVLFTLTTQFDVTDIFGKISAVVSNQTDKLSHKINSLEDLIKED